jgi:hypothetical protein
MDTLCETLDILASHSMALTQYRVSFLFFNHSDRLSWPWRHRNEKLS